MSYARKLTACPHCGVTVCFDAAGVCPSCHVPGDAPVTDADRARIERVRSGSARPSREPDPELSPWQTYKAVRWVTLLGLLLVAFCLGIGRSLEDRPAEPSRGAAPP